MADLHVELPEVTPPATSDLGVAVGVATATAEHAQRDLEKLCEEFDAHLAEYREHVAHVARRIEDMSSVEAVDAQARERVAAIETALEAEPESEPEPEPEVERVEPEPPPSEPEPVYTHRDFFRRLW